MELLVDWPEFVAMLFFLAGMVFAFFSGSFWALYFVAFLMGLLFGRVLYRQKKSNKVPLAFTVLLFLLGLFFGSFFSWIRWITLFLAIGIIVAYVLHETGWIESVEF